MMVPFMFQKSSLSSFLLISLSGTVSLPESQYFEVIFFGEHFPKCSINI